VAEFTEEGSVVVPKPRLLLVKLADLGDAVLLTAAVDAASRSLPGYDVDVLVGLAGAPIFEPDPRVRKMWAFDRRLLAGRRAFSPPSLLAWGRLLWALRRERYDAVILAHHLTTVLGTLKLASLALACGAPVRVGLDNGRGAFLNLRSPDEGMGAVCEGAYWVRLVGMLAGAPVRGGLGVRIAPDAEARAAELLPDTVPRPVIAIHHALGGWIPSRAWNAPGYARVAEILHAKLGATLLLIGGPEERGAAEQVAALSAAPMRVLAGETDVQTLAALLGRCDLYLGPDSGPMQLAAALGVPVVSLWGPTNEAAWGPCEEIGAGKAVCLRAPDRPEPWVYVGHRMGAPARRSDLGSLEPAQVAEAVIGLLEAGRPG
jgi:heptosyltransferase-2